MIAVDQAAASWRLPWNGSCRCGRVSLRITDAEFWTSEKLPWASTSAKLSFATEPPDAAFTGILEAFAREGARPAE